MEASNRRYSDEEVTAIIRRALSRGGPQETISHDELVDIARTSGITADRLEAAVREQEDLGDLEAARAEWIRRQRHEFFSHLTSYCIVNGFLLFVNVVTTRYPWVMWPLAGWGIGLAFHAVSTFVLVDEEQVERGAQKILRKKRERMEFSAERG